MARGGRISVDVDFTAVKRQLMATLNRVDRGTKKATIAAANDIMDLSLSMVPRETTTLARSAFIKISGRSKNFSAEIGYGGNGDPINPKSGQKASQYMVVVHEDLSAVHPVGQAKFLENAVSQYKSRFVPNSAIILKSELRL